MVLDQCSTCLHLIKKVVNNVGKAFELFPLAFALSTADMEATYFLDKQV